jgi:hypothetical protein
MLILPWNIQYRRFLPLTYNIITCSIYIILLIIAIYAQMLFGRNDTIFLNSKNNYGYILIYLYGYVFTRFTYEIFR